MQLQLTDEEAVELHDLLQEMMPALQREGARTERRDFRRLLVQRLDLVERLLTDLPLEGSPKVAR